MRPALDLLKSMEPTESLWFVFNDAQVPPFLMGWGLYDVTYSEPIDEIPATLNVGELRIFCWSQIEEPDYDLLAVLSGLTAPACREKFFLCSKAGLIYPDGSLSERALNAIRANVQTNVAALVSSLPESQQTAQIEPAPAETLPTKARARERAKRPAKRKIRAEARKR